MECKKISLILASYVFYSAWNPPLIVLLIGATIINWTLVQKIIVETLASKRKRLLLYSIVVNLMVLMYFKYGQFLLDNFISFVNMFGYQYTPPELDIILPIGISFYTFQAMSYVIDAYKKKIDAQCSLIDFSLYISFFPQLVAGPIVRAGYFLPQCKEPKSMKTQMMLKGLLLFSVGIFAKVVVADSITAPVVNNIYDNVDNIGSIEA